MPKKKQISPEEKLKKFNEWKMSEEYKLLVEIKTINNKLKNDPLISKYDQLSDDFTGKFDDLLESFSKIQSVFAIKGTKIKTILQEHLRTIYFAAPPDRDKVFTVDLESLEFPDKCKAYPQESRHLRNKFIEIIEFSDNVEDLDENDYEFNRKERLVNKFKEFAKKFKVHVAKDKAHVLIKKFLYQVIDPLVKWMEVNNKLFIFSLQNEQEVKFKENSFQYKALIMEFCKRYQYCQEILYKKNKNSIKSNPNIFSIFKKINYENWQNNSLEKYFISPLFDSLMELKVNLNKLYLLGFNFWRQPLSDNKEFLKNMMQLIENENKTELLLGDHLKRNQINFFYNAFLRIYNSQVRDKFIDLKKLSLTKTKIVTPIAILKAIENFNNVIEKKLKYIKNYNLEKDYLENGTRERNNTIDNFNKNTLNEFENDEIDYSLLNANDPDKILTKQEILPNGITYKEEILWINGEKMIIPFDDNDYWELEKFGRLFILQNYIPEDKLDDFFKLCKDIKLVNKTIIKDLENYIIVEGLYLNENELDKTDNINKDTIFSNNKQIDNLKQIEDDEKTYFKRPPYLFNEINNLNEHKLYYYNNPLDVYEDGKIRQIYDKILMFAEILENQRKFNWNFMIDNIFDLFNHMNKNLN